jgi:hypothetical protein
VHSGQVGQPNPEPVKRTAPPVTTIAAWAKSKNPLAGDRTRAARARSVPMVVAYDSGDPHAYEWLNVSNYDTIVL